MSRYRIKVSDRKVAEALAIGFARARPIETDSRRRIDVDRAVALYNMFGNWRLVALAMGGRFQGNSICSAVYRADKGRGWKNAKRSAVTDVDQLPDCSGGQRPGLLREDGGALGLARGR